MYPMIFFASLQIALHMIMYMLLKFEMHGIEGFFQDMLYNFSISMY